MIKDKSHTPYDDFAPVVNGRPEVGDVVSKWNCLCYQIFQFNPDDCTYDVIYSTGGKQVRLNQEEVEQDYLFAGNRVMRKVEN